MDKCLFFTKHVVGDYFENRLVSSSEAAVSFMKHSDKISDHWINSSTIQYLLARYCATTYGECVLGKPWQIFKTQILEYLVYCDFYQINASVCGVCGQIEEDCDQDPDCIEKRYGRKPTIPTEHVTWHKMEIFTLPDGKARIEHATNDDNDDGIPDGAIVKWTSTCSSVARALEITGKSRLGVIGCDVTVTVDGVKI